MTERKSSSSRMMYGISRIDDEVYRTHAWRVSLHRQGKRLVKNFPDKTYGGKGKALKHAKQYRDGLLKQYPPTTRKEFCTIIRRNNTSGVSGVCVYEKPYELADGTVKTHRYWEANWPLTDGRYAKASFSVKHYGEKKARALAVRARRQGLRQLEGVFWRSKRGVTETSKSFDT